MRRSRRITVRLGQDDWVTVQSMRQGAGLDISGVIRAALRAATAPKEGNTATPKPPKPFTVPDRIRSRTPKYRAWANGNLRAEWNRQFDEMFALTLVCREFFPRTPGIAQVLAHLADIERRFPRG